VTLNDLEQRNGPYSATDGSGSDVKIFQRFFFILTRSHAKKFCNFLVAKTFLKLKN